MISYVLLVTYLVTAMEQLKPESDTRPFVGVSMQEFASEDSCKAAAKRLEDLSGSMEFRSSYSNLARPQNPRRNTLMTACVPK